VIQLWSGPYRNKAEVCGEKRQHVTTLHKLLNLLSVENGLKKETNKVKTGRIWTCLEKFRKCHIFHLRDGSLILRKMSLIKIVTTEWPE
jgi:hypothetical protein